MSSSYNRNSSDFVSWRHFQDALARLFWATMYTVQYWYYWTCYLNHIVTRLSVIKCTESYSYSFIVHAAVWNVRFFSVLFMLCCRYTTDWRLLSIMCTASLEVEHLVLPCITALCKKQAFACNIWCSTTSYCYYCLTLCYILYIYLLVKIHSSLLHKGSGNLVSSVSTGTVGGETDGSVWLDCWKAFLHTRTYSYRYPSSEIYLYSCSVSCHAILGLPLLKPNVLPAVFKIFDDSSTNINRFLHY